MLKLGFRLSISIEHRVFFIPWVQRHSRPQRILCSEKRDYSSGLSKYVPNKSRKIGDKFTSQPVDSFEKGRYGSRLDHSNKNEDNGSFGDSGEGIMSLEKGVNDSMLGSEANGRKQEATESKFLDLREKSDARCYMSESFDESSDGVMSLEKGINPSRWGHSVYASKVKSNFKEAGQDKDEDGMPSNESCDDSDEELEESSNDVRSKGYQPMRQHKIAYDVVKQQIEAKQAKSSGEACKTTQGAENMAIRYLGLRAYSAAELKKKLIGKNYSLEIVDRVISDFQHRGFINDSLYAESFSRSRWSSLSWGPRLIKHALFKKGISNQDSEAAIKLVFEKGQCKEGDEKSEPNYGLSKEAIDQLYVQASKRWLQSRDLPIETRKARVIRWLQYRGYNWGVVSQLLKRLESRKS